MPDSREYLMMNKHFPVLSLLAIAVLTSCGSTPPPTPPAPTCMDGVKNGMETDVDCGGPVCGPCAAGKACTAATDCTTAVCQGNLCVAASCMDGVKNGDETDVDCGGSC